MSIKKRILAALLVVVLFVAGGFAYWANTPNDAEPEAFEALKSDPGVTVTQNGDMTVFAPADSQPTTGFIFYPGGRVDYRAYAPVLRLIAEKGYLVVLVRMPLSLAVTAPDRAAQALLAFPSIRNWAIGGHSLGGVMAAHFILTHPGTMDGLVLWASYPAEKDSLKNSSIRVVSISASQDGLSTPAKIEASRALLPEDTQFVVIPGGNHAGFGAYGSQKGDGNATIPPGEQWQLTAESTAGLLESISGGE
jgi:pimeloyl-ACP methyl ester carboxylesterase